MTTIGKPKIDTRPEQVYMGIRTIAPFKGMSKVIGKLSDELNAWVDEHKVQPAGPPFLRYHVIDMRGFMDIEFGFPLRKALPDDGDLNEHRVELPVEGLPPGRYTLLASNEATFTYKKSLVVATSFQCTQLAATQREVPKGEEVLVVHRGTGAPISDATVTMQVRRWSGGAERWAVAKEDRTDADGIAVFGLGENREQYRWVVKALGQELITGHRYYGRYQYEGEVVEEPRTFLFLDRGIYRPGQPIQFKGIVTIKRDKAVEVMANYSTVVRRFDVNSERVDT
jgi:hypothetical protein